MPSPVSLPIDALLPEILDALEGGNLVLQASPGSGKTTRVPPALLQARWLKPAQRIDVLVPRRLAAKLAAHRVAEERGEKVGGTVGYQFRFENVTGPETRIRFLTEGLLLRQLLRDPLLSGTGIVVLDEFHERNLHSDVALAHLRALQGERRPDLRILVMSATLESRSLARYLEPCRVLQRELAPYPVEIHHAQASEDPLEVRVARALRQAFSLPEPGDVLVFLPGMAEIRRAESLLLRDFSREAAVLPLHGELPRQEQEKVFAKYPLPKVILSTNIAETSVTIDGVRTVIDAGLQRQASYSWWNGIPALRTRPVPKAGAVQRAGRAGRQGPGRCFRLYTLSDFQGRPDFEKPELQRADLSQALLEIKSLGQRLSDFPWFEAPPAASLSHGLELLNRLKALSGAGIDAPLNEMGRRMAELPLHPRLSRMLLAAEAAGILDEGAWLAARLSEEVSDGLDVLHESSLKRGSESLQRLYRQLQGFFARPETRPRRLSEAARDEALAMALLQGFPDRVAKKRETSGHRQEAGRAREGKERELVFCDGGSGVVFEEPVVSEHEYFVVLSVQEVQDRPQARGRVRIRSLCPIRAEWLFDMSGDLLREERDLFWEESARRVIYRERIAYGQLTLDESVTGPPNVEAASALLLKKGLGLDVEEDSSSWSLPAVLEALRHWTDPAPLAEQLARIQLFVRHFPQSAAPSFEDGALKERLIPLFRGMTRLEEVEGKDLGERLLGALPASLLGELQRQCPMAIALPGGRRVKVHYSREKAPWIASRLQDFFGMKDLPSILSGRVPLSAELLAPNQRPVQVTSDLASFWRNAYPALRKELGRRYPRHAWPENPLVTAPPMKKNSPARRPR